MIYLPVSRIQWFRIVIFLAGLSSSIATVYAMDLPESAHIPFKAVDSADDLLIYRAVFTFIVAGAAAYGLAWCIKRFAPGFLQRSVCNGSKLERLETMRLSTRSVLFRVRFGDEELLIGESEHCVALLSRQALRHATNEESLNE